MNDDRIDFSSIDPTRDQAHFEEMVSSIVRDAEVELARRQGRLTVVGQVGQWWRPLLAAALVVIAVSLGALWQTGGESGTIQVEAGIEESLGVPTAVATWLRSDELPTTSALLETIEVSQ